jgi:hypothetical protein
MANEERYGQSWNDEELDLIVADYFSMLRLELDGEPYSKSEFRRALVKQIGRTEGSIERKHQNISAVLLELEMRTIDGYKPLPNYQDSILDAVDRFFVQNPQSLTLQPNAKGILEAPSLFVEPAPTLEPLLHRPRGLERLVRKFDPAERDFKNRVLGNAGEEMILEHEKRNLTSLGRRDLAQRIRWISKLDDSAGYDIHSFDSHGRDRLLEVKTTNGRQRAPFYLTRNEFDVSNKNPTLYRICRLYDFSKQPRMFELAPPLNKLVTLETKIFEASFRAATDQS